MWPAIRAALVTLAIAFGLADGCPIPAARQRARMSPGAVAAIDAVDGVRKTVLRPVRPVAELLHVRQRWALFRGAPRNRYRLRIEARTAPDAPWELLFRPQDDAAAFLAGPLAYRRVRGGWDPSGSLPPRGAYRSFVTWVAGEVFARQPRFQEVRVQYEKIRIRDGGGYDPTGELAYPQVRRRGEVAR